MINNQVFLLVCLEALAGSSEGLPTLCALRPFPQHYSACCMGPCSQVLASRAHNLAIELSFWISIRSSYIFLCNFPPCFDTVYWIQTWFLNVVLFFSPHLLCSWLAPGSASRHHSGLAQGSILGAKDQTPVKNGHGETRPSVLSHRPHDSYIIAPETIFIILASPNLTRVSYENQVILWHFRDQGCVEWTPRTQTPSLLQSCDQHLPGSELVGKERGEFESVHSHRQ